LAATRTPASSVMRAALGERGAHWIAFGIAVSTLGFLSQGILTAPRVYYAMSRDGLFFKSVGWLSPKTRVPAVAIVLQGVTATVWTFPANSAIGLIILLAGIPVYLYWSRKSRPVQPDL